MSAINIYFSAEAGTARTADRTPVTDTFILLLIALKEVCSSGKVVKKKKKTRNKQNTAICPDLFSQEISQNEARRGSEL